MTSAVDEYLRDMWRTHKVTKKHLDVAASVANEMMLDDPDLAERWMDHNRSGVPARAAGGMIHYETDYDWIVAFFVWQLGHGSRLPRIR